MNRLHRAALKRAYRTLAQGLGGSATATAITAALAALMNNGTDPGSAALLALAATIGGSVVAAFTSYWQGIARGLPEVPLGPA